MAIQPMPAMVAEDVSRTLGAIEKALEIFVEEFRRERDKADDHRRALRETISALSEAVRMLTQEVAEMKPHVDDYRQRTSEAKGRANLGRALMAFWMAMAGGVTALVTWLLSSWKPHP